MDDQTRELDRVEAPEQNGEGPVSGTISDQPKIAKESWLSGQTDLQDLELDMPEPVNDTVVIRSLSAAQLASIRDACLTMKGDTAKVDSRRMAVMKFQRAVKEPEFDEREVEHISKTFGKSFSLVVNVIDEVSEATEEDIAKARRRFRPRR